MHTETLPKIAYQLAIERAQQLARSHERWTAFYNVPFCTGQRNKHALLAKACWDLVARLEAHEARLGNGSRPRVREPIVDHNPPTFLLDQSTM